MGPSKPLLSRQKDGLLIKCDPPMKKYIQHLAQRGSLRLVQLIDLDSSHLFAVLHDEAGDALQEQITALIDELHDKNTYLIEGSDARDNRFRIGQKTEADSE